MVPLKIVNKGTVEQQYSRIKLIQRVGSHYLYIIVFHIGVCCVYSI
jgi:hypothetical protein